MSASDRQRASTYPSYFHGAVLPDDVASYDCEHDFGVCACQHDWRITWGNVPRRTKGRNVLLTGE